MNSPIFEDSHPCFGGGSTETSRQTEVATPGDASHPCFGGGSTETFICFISTPLSKLAPLLRRGFH